MASIYIGAFSGDSDPFYGNNILLEAKTIQIKLSLEDLIKKLKKAKNKIYHGYNKFKIKELGDKLEYLFKEIADEGGGFKSRYGLFDNLRKHYMIRVATHAQPENTHIKKDIEDYVLDKVYDFRFFDNADQHNLIEYTDKVHNNNKYTYLTSKGKKEVGFICSVDIDSEHFNDKDSVIKILDAMIECLENETEFVHPFLNQTATEALSLQQFIKEQLRAGRMRPISFYL